MKKFTWKDDKRFYLDTPDVGFSPARNKAVINKTIKDYEDMRKKRFAEASEGYSERADAISTYFKILRQGKRPHLKKFFSKKYLAKLRGDDIREELYARMKVYNNQGGLLNFHDGKWVN